MISMGDGPDGFRCSRAGCREPATSNVNWRNPRIHAEGRVKVWLACAEHTEYLHDYLSSRGFPVSVGPLGSPAVIVEAP